MTRLFAIREHDTRIQNPSGLMLPEFSYFQVRDPFTARITVTFHMPPPTKPPVPADGGLANSSWCEVHHEAWGRAAAASPLELFSVYAEGYLADPRESHSIEFRLFPVTGLFLQQPERSHSGCSRAFDFLHLADVAVQVARYSEQVGGLACAIQPMRVPFCQLQPEKDPDHHDHELDDHGSPVLLPQMPRYSLPDHCAATCLRW
ncbi:hypothetical protein [Erythrobacter sp. JK5]|uniref:hypothetical protein n=1 Tax=Erythrobacter sp. JK5 TaxID=2829500 RepID=UPI001BAC7438|nr:hypothetical protein [Erythrobacter sp. JK5]QUL37640.1 hypothetical protein KDC96_15045 [Erythrobacter sp. JK5]